MNKEQIIALLKKHGVEVDANSTAEQLQAKLEDVLAQAKKPTPTPTPAPAPTAAVPGPSAPNDDVTNRLAKMEAKYEAERKTRLTSAVAQCVADRRIPAAQQDAWVADCMRDEAILARLQAMPQVLPPDGITVECVSESISDICAHAKQMGVAIHNEAILDLDRGPSGIRAASIAKARATLFRKNDAKFREIWNTNTIPAQLQQDIIIDVGLRAFVRVLFPLTRFCTLLSNVPLRGTDIVQVPFIDLVTDASTQFNAGTGYAPGNTTITYRPVTIDQRYYQGLGFTSQEIARQPFLWVERQMQLKGEKLAYDVWAAGIGLLKVANGYSIADGWPKAAGAMDSNALNKLRVAANVAQWSESGRFIVTNAAYDGSLAEDNALKLALNIGGTELIRGGKIPNLYGFDYFTNSLLPDNGVHLAGFIATQSAAIMAQAPIPPVEEVLRAGTQYSMAVDPQTGATLEYRSFGSNVLDRGERYIECNYGFGKGNAAAAQLLTDQ